MNAAFARARVVLELGPDDPADVFFGQFRRCRNVLLVEHWSNLLVDHEPPPDRLGGHPEQLRACNSNFRFSKGTSTYFVRFESGAHLTAGPSRRRRLRPTPQGGSYESQGIVVGVLVIGVALIVAPLAMGMPGKAAAGQRMLNGFQPIMAPASVQKTADYYYNVFVPLGQITPMFSNANADKFSGYLQGMQTVRPADPAGGGEGLHAARRRDEAGGADRRAGSGGPRAGTSRSSTRCRRT